jgi:hypothetical protein
MRGGAALGPYAALLLEASNGVRDTVCLFRACRARLQVILHCGRIAAEQEVGELFVGEVIGEMGLFEVAFH